MRIAAPPADFADAGLQQPLHLGGQAHGPQQRKRPYPCIGKSFLDAHRRRQQRPTLGDHIIDEQNLRSRHIGHRRRVDRERARGVCLPSGASRRARSPIFSPDEPAAAHSMRRCPIPGARTRRRDARKSTEYPRSAVNSRAPERAHRMRRRSPQNWGARPPPAARGRRIFAGSGHCRISTANTTGVNGPTRRRFRSANKRSTRHRRLR